MRRSLNKLIIKYKYFAKAKNNATSYSCIFTLLKSNTLYIIKVDNSQFILKAYKIKGLIQACVKLQRLFTISFYLFYNFDTEFLP